MSFYCEVNGCIELVVTLNDGLAGQAMAAQRNFTGKALCVWQGTDPQLCAARVSQEAWLPLLPSCYCCLSHCASSAKLSMHWPERNEKLPHVKVQIH